MAKQELAHIARVIYDLQEYCRYIDELNNHEECNGCTFLFDHVKCRLIALTKDNKIPCDNWNITKADVERLKCIEGELSVKVPVEWLKSAVQANKELEHESND